MTVSLAAPERSALLITRMIRCFPVDETAALGDCIVRMHRYFRYLVIRL